MGFDWMGTMFLLAYDTVTQETLIVAASMIGAILSPELMGLITWF